MAWHKIESRVVQHLPRHLKVEGSIPAAAAAPAGKRATGGKRREKGFSKISVDHKLSFFLLRLKVDIFRKDSIKLFLSIELYRKRYSKRRTPFRI
jgi:hypothetical protein